MLISIITVCYNSANTIRKTIESVLCQTYQEVEYLIIDGLSTDGTVTVAKEYEEQFVKKGYSFRIISEKDNGIYDAMNKGIRFASGELVGIINSSDWYEKDALSTVAETYEKSKFDLFYSDINLIKENGQVIVKHSKNDKFPTSRHWNHPTTFVTKKTYDELGTFKCVGLHDDFDFFLRCKRAGKKTIIVNKVLANFAMGGASNKKDFSLSRKRCKDRLRCYTDNGYSKVYVIECIAIEAAKWMLS